MRAPGAPRVHIEHVGTRCVRRGEGQRGSFGRCLPRVWSRSTRGKTWWKDVERGSPTTEKQAGGPNDERDRRVRLHLIVSILPVETPNPECVYSLPSWRWQESRDEVV